ncbi:PTB domain-containing adapter protein ced-6-like isoform X2 [Liolophura sinensis]|uniref:PTB domain-containing adapter protein ced-6-like isoform X2 n=1 Tax=Liolophura sinensis TaxID=3198878 RepID=UPI003158E766
MDDTMPLELAEEIEEFDMDRAGNVPKLPHNEDFGQRKYIHIGSNGASGGGSKVSGSGNTSSRHSPAGKPSVLSPSSFKLSSSGSSSSSVRTQGGATSRPTAFAKWVQSHQSSQKDTVSTQGSSMKSLNKQWVHPPDSLVKGHIVYNVKFLGETEVEQPKGTDVVRDAIRKMKFSRHIRKAEGQKPPKVELTISADGVTIQDPKNKVIMHQYPLHRISYCADDKADKRMFTFIAKAGDSSKHFCYVFDSEKCAEEITLTVGQAFDLAYRRFLESSGKDMDQKKQHLLLQKKVQTLQQENEQLKKRITEISQLKDRSDLEQYKQANNIADLTAIRSTSTNNNNNSTSINNSRLPQSPTPASSKPAVGRRLENLVFDDNFTVAQTNGTNHQHSPAPLISPPPASVKLRAQSTGSIQSPVSPPHSTNPFHRIPPTVQGATASPAAYDDPFGMGAFTPTKNPQELDVAIQNVDNELMDLQTGFSRGISFGTDDFSLEDLDPLNQK